MKITEQLTKLLHNNDLTLTREIFESVVKPNLHLIKSGNKVNWDQPGWYQAVNNPIPIEELIAENAQGRFDVPEDCIYWYAQEKHHVDDLIFRFFYKSAWLDVDVPKDNCKACCLVFYAFYPIFQEAIDKLSLTLNQIQIPFEITPCDFDRYQIKININQDAISSLQETCRLRLTLSTPVMGQPALILVGSRDFRKLSFAISQPFLL